MVMSMIRICNILLFVLILMFMFKLVVIESTASKKLQIGIKKRPEDCSIKSRKGDLLHMHYTGTLDDGTEFDSSIPRGNPLTFKLGSGQVIKGWDQGLLGMCEGEQRKLVIPPELAYGSAGAPPKIPKSATLTFHVELVKIERKDEL
ncbi:peptidyl-prolyl cis-trans isomerase FKBP2 [Bombyx mori]|uniref:peptidylprolyl isomerase n=1 Tax=Bombyx mori TaxID=7091 RepID=A0A8R1WK12_BOMMO|nr:peptidyl-prolyl cis-trans isomerase FKBP2 [Bombyx mori]